MKGFRVLAMFLAVGLVFAISPMAWQDTLGQVADARTFLRIASGGPGGVYFYHGSAIASYLSKVMPDLKVTVDATGGSKENVRRVDSKESELGLAFIYNAYEAYKGIEEWERAYTNIRGIAMYLWPATNWVTLKSTGIKCVQDLKGKKMSLGPPGSGSAVIATRMLKVLGVYDSIQKSYLPFADAAQALKDGHIDAFVGPGGTPAAALTDVAATHDMVLISLTEEELNKCLTVLPGSTKAVVPPGTYRGVDEPVYQTCSPSCVIVHKDVPEELVYEITRAFFSKEGLDFAKTVHADWGRVPLDQKLLEGMVIPLHPGAARYWRELGLKIPKEAEPID